MKKRPESLAVELVRIWGQLDPVDEWRPVLDQAAAGLRRLAAVEAERDQLRAEVEALRADSALLDWMQRQSLDDFAVGLVVDAPHDGDFWCSPDTGGMYYGKTLREAMLAARKG